MKASVRKVSSNGGVVAPYLDGRIDLARYATGLIDSKNQIPCDWGGSVTRPGLVYDARLTGPTVIFEYTVSSAVSYVLLFSEFELRIWDGSGFVQDGGGDLVITTPYTESELYELKIDSLVDLLWIAHPNHYPRRLTRGLAGAWDFDLLPLYRPAMILRAGETETITPSGTTKGSSITLTASSALFNVGHEGSYWRIGEEVESSTIEFDIDGSHTAGAWNLGTPGTVVGDWSFTTSGTWVGKIRLMRSTDGGATYSVIRESSVEGNRNVASTGTEDEPVLMRIDYYKPTGVLDPNYANNPQAVVEFETQVVYGLVQIDAGGFVSDTVVNATVISTLYGTSATEFWEEGAWSTYRGFPACVATHERRLIFAATQSFPNRFWASRQSDRQDFQLADDEQSPFSFDLPSRDTIQWMLSERTLTIGTRSEEIILSSGRDDLPLSQQNANPKVVGSIGSSRVQAIKSSNAILYAESRGRRIREISVDEIAGDVFQNGDITAFAPHIFDASVLQMAQGKWDQDCVFVLLSNGKLVAINHNRDQKISSWFTIETQGTFTSVAKNPGNNTEDKVYVVTKRTINGSDHYQLEHFAVDQWDYIETGDISEMIYSDMATTVTLLPNTNVVTGLGDWEGEEVTILADGAVQTPKTVTGGQITLDEDAQKVVLGLAFESKFTPLWFEDVQTPSQGRPRKVTKLYVQAYNSGNMSVQASDEETYGDLEEGEQLGSYAVPRRNFADLLGAAPALETGFFEISLPTRHSRRQTVTFSRSAPLPMIIQSIHSVYDIGTK